MKVCISKHLGLLYLDQLLFHGSHIPKVELSGISDNKGKVKKCLATSPTAIAAIKAVIDKDARFWVGQMQERIDIHSSSVVKVMRIDLAVRKLLTRRIPNILSDKNKGVGLKCAPKLLNKYET